MPTITAMLEALNDDFCSVTYRDGEVYIEFVAPPAQPYVAADSVGQAAAHS